MKKFFLQFIFYLTVILLPQFCQATTVAPTILEISLDPGESQQAIITLFNETNDDLYLSGSVEVFEPDGERGEARVLEPEITDQAVGWVKLPLNALVLAPREAVEVPVIVELSQTAEVGGYYLAVMWQTAAGPNRPANQVQLSGRVGVLMLLEVKGDVDRRLKVEDFRLIDGDNFYSNLPVGFSVKLKNEGNIHLKPESYVMIKNIFNKPSQVLLVNQDKGNILPASSRRFESFWQRGEFVPLADSFIDQLRLELRQFAFGRFTAQAVVSYGPEATTVSSDKLVFWVVPWRLLSVIGFLFLAILMVMIFKKRRDRKRIINLRDNG